ncbi:FeS cluster assembly protein sufD [Pannonibacter phragmitetus]|uniref:FeS cluster assembly protein sufD n=1 Tax=Pannonibacter phragmitetus TaxID=121719 RepID=A0A378ZW17_9HYPH|nr:Fe-S cluster assembly protein SufD [Pannonibacter phragmitetus]SUB01258.1 FeS cluster assembly protein sufD [Pannonibacter phragmitetus]
MTANLRVVSTQAETDLEAHFAALKDGGADLISLREAAFARFRATGLPHRRIEEWKYTDLRAFLKSYAAPAAAASLEAVKAALADAETYAELERLRIVLANGRLVAEVSDLAKLEAAGVEVSNFNDAVKNSAQALLSNPEISGVNPALELNTALLQGGVVLKVKAGTAVDLPVEIVHLALGGAVYARVRTELGKGASLTLLESFVTAGEDAVVNAVSDQVLADEAALTATRLIVGSGRAPHISTAFSHLGAKAELKTLGFIAGTDFARNQSYVTFAGEHSTAKLYGVTMVRGQQLGDQTLVVDHAVPNCESREFFKTVIDAGAKGVYQGKIIVRPHAQKTDGQMMTQALLLSEDAEMANKPELEIFADDVQCAHGATSGQIDEDLLFYLRARGIPEAEARTLLVLAFLSEAIEEFGSESVTELLETRVREWLAIAG